MSTVQFSISATVQFSVSTYKRCLVIYQRPLKFEISGHPSLSFTGRIQVSFYNIRRKTVALCGAYTTTAARSPAVMAIAKHHNPLAENATCRILGANPRIEENIIHKERMKTICCSFYMISLLCCSVSLRHSHQLRLLVHTFLGSEHSWFRTFSRLSLV